MVRNVVVGVDGSERSRKALAYALERFPEATVTAVTVVDAVGAAGSGTGEYADGSRFEVQRDLAEGVLDRASEAAAEYDRDIDTSLRVGSASREILAAADEVGADHVVVGSRGRTGLSRVLLGSVAESVVRRARVPVTVVR